MRKGISYLNFPEGHLGKLMQMTYQALQYIYKFSVYVLGRWFRI